MSHKTKELYKFGGFRLDVSERLLLNSDGEKISLPEKVFAVLCLLARKSGSLVSKEELLETVWDGAFVEENNLDKTISALRRALGEKRGEKVFIETVRKHGYRFVAEVERVENTEAAPLENKETVRTENAPPDNLPPAAAKVADNHRYTVNRRGNVLAVADWQQARESEAAANFSLDDEEENDLPIAPAAQTKSRLVWTSRHTAILLALFTLLFVVLSFNANHLPVWQVSKDSRLMQFQHVNFKKVVGSDKGYSPAIAPDGKTAAYRDENNFIWLANLTTGSRVQLKNGDEAIKGIWLKFAPDGNYLYYVWKPDNEPNNAIYQVAVPGGAPRKIVGDAWTGAAVSPDGKQIAFARRNVSAGDEYALFVINTDGTNERKIASHSSPNWFALYGNYIAWSPDGKSVAGVGSAPDYKIGDSGHIIVVNVADGAEFVVPNPDWKTAELDELTWTADGSSLLVVARSGAESSFQIWQVSYPQGVWNRVTNDLNNYSKVDVSADGKTLITAQEKSESHLWQMPLANPENTRQLTFGQTYKDGNTGLAFTPDGERIVYSSSEGGNYEIWTANADGSNRKQLTFGSEFARDAAVTPDNRYIVFTNSTNGVPHLWRMNIDGSNPVQLTNGAGEIAQSAITPDSRSVIYTSIDAPPKNGLYRISIDGGEPTLLTDKFGGYVPVISPDGKWIAYNFYNYETAETPLQSGIIPVTGGEPIKTFEQPNRGLMCWTADSKSLLHLDKNWMNVWRKPIFGKGSPEQITDFNSEAIRRFALSPDGKQLILARGAIETSIVVVDNGK